MFTVYILDTHEVRDYIMSLYVYVIHAMFTVYLRYSLNTRVHYVFILIWDKDNPMFQND